MVSMRRVRRMLEGNVVDIVPNKIGGVFHASQYKDEDIGVAVNRQLQEAGADGSVDVQSGVFTKASGEPLDTPIETTAEGQTIDFNSAVIELDDGVNEPLVKISHDGAKIKNLQVLGNQSNNTPNPAVTNTTPVNDIEIEDVEGDDVDRVIELDGVDDSDIRNSGTIPDGVGVSDAIVMENSTDTAALNCRVSNFSNDGIRIANCDDMVFRAVGILPSDGAGASHGFHILGTRDSVFGGTVAGDDNISKGVYDTGYDVGGANERFSTGNLIDVQVSGVSDIGFHISDAEKERVYGVVNGEHTNGRTTQAFLVDAPNGLANPQHDINITGTTITRITDTNQTGPNVGMRLEGHFSKVQNTCTLGAGGNSVVDFVFGQATPSPVVETVGSTQVIFEEQSNKTTTNPSGRATVDWSDDYALGTKPVLSVTLEQAGQWHVNTFNTDGNGRYTDAVIQVTDSSGTAVGNGVETNLIVVGT